MKKTKKLLATLLSLVMIISACSVLGLVHAAAGDYAGMVLNFETGDRDVTTGTHPGYETYYGKQGDAKNGNASRINGFNVGYVNSEGVGHDSDGAMVIAYSAEGTSAKITEHAGFNTAHTGTNANTLANYRPYYGQMFRATVWFKVKSITGNAKLGFRNNAATSNNWSGGINLSTNGVSFNDNVYGTGVALHTLKDLTAEDVDAGWQSASVVFMGGGNSTATATGNGGAGYITLVMEDNTKRVGTEVYIDDITIEHLGDAVAVTYNLDGGTISSNCAGGVEYGLPGSPLMATAQKEGFRFEGWYSDSSLTTPATVVPQANATLYAKWKMTSCAGMVLNFENGTQDTTTGTHPGYEAYYGAPGANANGNASRLNGVNVGYVNGDGLGHNSNGAMKMAYSSNSANVTNTLHAAFNTAHTGTNATTLANYRPYYGQMFRATVWYKVESITEDASLNFYTNSSYTGTKGGVNLSQNSTYGTPAGTPFANLTSADVEKGWQQASVTFMGGGTSTATATGSGSAGYITLVMSNDTNRVGTVVYVDDITIEHIGEAIEVKYNANGGTISGSDSQYGRPGDTLTGMAERDEYEFAGWYTDKTCTTPVTVIPEQNTTVYAKWEIDSYAGMTLNFENGTQDTTTGTHPGYEAYYGAPGANANGNATRVSGFDVGYVNSEGVGHNSNGAMKMAYSSNSANVTNSTHAAFNTAHTRTNANTLVNYRPYFGQMFRATVWYKVESLTVDASLNFYVASNYSGIKNGPNLNYGGSYGGTPFANLTSADVEKGWQQASVTFMGGGSSTSSESGSGSAGYIELMMSDDTNRVGTVVYVDDITIEHIGEAIEVKYNANGGTISGSDSQYGRPGDTLTGMAERDEYEFAGWYTDKTCTTPVTVIPEQNTTVYAKWEIDSYAGMTLNFENGTQDTTTGTHPGYEAYYGAPGANANGNATRVSGFDVGYVNSEGVGHNSNGAMKIAYSSNSDTIYSESNAAFNTAHTGTNANTLANYRPYYGQMFRATLWYKAENLTSDAELGFFVKSSKDGITGGLNLTQDKLTASLNSYGDDTVWHTFASLKADNNDGEWHSASVVFMGGGSSDFTSSGWGSPGYITLAISDNTNRLGTVVYIDDITIEPIGNALKVNYELDGGIISNSNGSFEYGVAGSSLRAEAAKTGYKFVGWYSNEALTEKTTVMPNEDGLTLYAKWEKSFVQRPGDINGDDVLTARDIDLLRQFLLGIIDGEEDIYDANGDEKVNICDLVHLKKLVPDNEGTPTLMNLMDGKGGAEAEATEMRSTISSLADVKPEGTVYYVSSNGDDNNNGTSAQAPFKTLEHLEEITLNSGDMVLLERNSVFRLSRPMTLGTGVTLGAYGKGDKPEIWGSLQNFAGKNLWKKAFYDCLWTLDYTGNDVGVVVINGGEAAGKKVHELNELKEMYDFAHINGKLYLMSPQNPNTYNDIEIGDKRGLISIAKDSTNVKISNIALKYTGGNALQSIGNASYITVSGCEIGWIGGSIQGANDNYTLYGNAIEFWDKSENITVENNWIYQIYDTGITFQGWGPYHDIKFSNNLIEYTTMAIEYWCYDHGMDITGISIDNNIIRFSGYGWGAKRVYNFRTAHINAGHQPTDYHNLEVSINNNIFDCSYQVIFRIPWATEQPEKQRYTITNNTYYQRSRSGENDLGLGGVENAAFAYGVLETVDLISSTASNQQELETAVNAVDSNPTLVCWLED